MNRNCLLNKILAMLLCAVLLIGYLPVSALPAAAATDDKWESEKDVLETTTEAPTEPETTVPEVEETTVPEAGEVKEYKMAMNKNGTMLYFNGSTESASVNYRLATTENEAEAVSVFLEPVAGGYHLYFMNGGVKTYIRVYERQDGDPGYGKGSLELVTTAPAEILTMDETTGTLFYTADDGENAYYMGTYSTYTTFSVSNTFYITGSNAGNVDVSQYPARFYEVTSEPETTEPEVEETTEPEVEETTEPEVEETTEPEVEETTEPALGSEQNPIFLFEQNNVVSNAGTVYYQGYFAGQTVTISGEVDFSVISEGETIPATEGSVVLTYPTVMGRPMPNVFAIVGDGEFTVNAAYPVGSMSNPATATLGDNVAAIESGSGEYFFNYTAEYTGKLLVEISSADGNWQYTINNMTTYQYGETQWSDSDPVVNPAEIDVTEGDIIEIKVITHDPADMWNIPAGEITVNLAYKPGSCEAYPVLLLETANMVTNVGTMYYGGYFSGMFMSIAGEGEFSVIYNGETLPSEDGCVWTLVSAPNPRMPVTFAIVGDGDYTITFAYPVGSMSNPATATLGDNVATIESGSGEYFFNYTAEYTGKLLVEISSADGNWQYTINNMTTYQYGETQWSDSDPVVNPAEIDVTEGDIIEIKVITYDPADMWNIPAGDITVYLSYEPGTCEAFRYVLDKNVQTVTNAGTKYYLARHSGCRMVISGEGDFSINYNGEVISSVYGFISTEVYSANPFFNPVVFELTGDGDYTIEFIYPAGHANNPATAFLGDNVAEIEENGSEYYFNYTAEQTGNLVIGISSNDGNWQYTVNNLTTLSYGDAQWSDSDPVVNPATIAVTQGDVIEIKVITYNPETPWVVSAGKITVNLSYEQILNGWVMEGSQWCYYIDGQKLTNGWAQDSAGWYYMGADGYAVKNTWAMSEGGWMYIGSDKHPVKNAWTQDSSGWYYMGADGYAVKNMWVMNTNGWMYIGSDKHPVRNDWAQDSVGWYFMGADGYAVKNAWAKDSSGWYYMGYHGRAVQNEWAMNEGGWMYLGSDKHPVKNAWTKDGAGIYYMGADGYAVKNTWAMNTKGWMYIGSNKHPVINDWAQDSAGWYFMGGDGYAVKNAWTKDSSGWFYMDETGRAVKNGWAKDSAGKLYMGADGHAVKNTWITVGGKKYFADANGYIVTGTQSIGGKLYTFDANGVLIG